MTDLERLLRFEKAHPRAGGRKDEAIWRELGMSPTAYAQRLNALLDDATAVAHDPVLLNRLRRLRAHRRALRGA